MTLLKKIRKNKHGQAATEYMLIVAVVVIGLVAAASHFITPFNDAVRALSTNVSGWLTKNQEMSNAGNPQ